MKAMELMLKLSQLHPGYEDFEKTFAGPDIKLTWLTDVFWRVVNEIIDKSENAKPHSEYEFREKAGMKVVTPDTDLLVEAPYDELYVYYLMAQLDLAYGETDKYNKHIILFDDAFNAFAKYYRQKHKPIGPKQFKYYGG